MVKLKLGVRSAGDLVAGVLPGSDNPTGGKDRRRYAKCLVPVEVRR
jgi:hypothetical protein